MRARTRWLSSIVVAAVVALGIVVPAAPATAAPSCSAFDSRLYDQIHPTLRTQALTARGDTANVMFMGGFSTTHSSTLAVATARGTGLKAVHFLYRASNKDRFYTTDTAEISRVAKKGFVDKGVAFYAGGSKASCLTAVWSYSKGGVHRFTTSSSERAALSKAGWLKGKLKFYVAVKPIAQFTIAVMPDTQQEVMVAGDSRMTNRAQWVVKTKSLLGTQFLVGTGDTVNWDTPDHVEYVRAQTAMQSLAGAVPYALAAGNHDTAAVGVGGSAADPANSWKLVRDTTSYNAFLAPGMTITQEYEAGHAENSYTEFTAAGRTWMVLMLELWPRKEVVAWAKTVVASHPRDNVIVSTHSYLTSSGAIYATNGGYGSTSPQYLYDNLIKQYANIKIVLSGHVGTAAFRKDVGVHGNSILSYLLTMHSNTTNPIRMLQINVTAGTVTSWVYAPATSTTYSDYRVAPRKMGWAR